jgi:hypothetical protein
MSAPRAIRPALSLALLLAGPASRACTLWAAQGTRVAGGATLIAKTRDWRPTDHQDLVLVRPHQGYAYYGLETRGQEAGLKMGLNEKGLAVESATASTVAKEDRDQAGRTSGLLRKLLAGCASVEEALARKALFKGARFMMLADRSQVAWVEIGPKGEVRVETRRNGTLAHTNHYLPGALEACNLRVPGPSSLARLDRIQALLAGKTLTFDDCLAFTRDAHDGADNSIFRTGSRPGGTRTEATWVVRLEPDGGAEVYARLLNAGEQELLVQRTALEIFGKQ